jgi:hypothetical protein
MNRELDLLQVAIQDASRAAFKNCLEAHPSEQFYAFALYTDDNLMGMNAAANSEEGYQKEVDKNKEYLDEIGTVDLQHLRWATVEWSYDHLGKQYFQNVDNSLRQASQNEFETNNEFQIRKAQVLNAMIVAWRNLDRDGFFGIGAERKKVTIFASTSDSDQGFEAENDSARALNPDSVFQSFIARYE